MQGFYLHAMCHSWQEMHVIKQTGILFYQVRPISIFILKLKHFDVYIVVNVSLLGFVSVIYFILHLNKIC
jgi:hypothetical protein